MDIISDGVEHARAAAAAGGQAAAPSIPVILGLAIGFAAMAVAAVAFLMLVGAVGAVFVVVHKRARKVRVLPGTDDTAAIELAVSSSDHEDAPDDF